MPPYRILALPESVAREVRETGRSPRYGHATHAEVATGYGPCRLCLQFFRKGEERRILFTYDSFADTESLPLPGPVFIHESPCARYPEDAGFPQHLGRHRLTGLWGRCWTACWIAPTSTTCTCATRRRAATT
jgi:hypothetical protein